MMAKLNQTIIAHADRCVLCGLCSTECPTYVRTKVEPESPRGRISMLKGLAAGDIEPSDELRTYIDHCLQCMACQSVCPSKVEYGSLLDAGKQLLSADRKSLLAGIGLRALTSPRWTGFLIWVAGAVHSSGLFGLLNRFAFWRDSRLGKAAKKSLTLRAPRHQRSPERFALNGSRGRVLLVSGCLGQSGSPGLVEAAAKLIHALGFALEIQQPGMCCGAVHRHNGAFELWQKLAARNRVAASKAGVDHVVHCASGCVDTLQKNLAETKVWELCDFIDSHWVPTLKPTQSFGHILVQSPCSISNELGLGDCMASLIARIPSKKTSYLPDRCCGAGGTHFLQFPAIADHYMQQLVGESGLNSCDYLLSANLGCSLHIQQWLGQAMSQPEVLHPVALLAKSLALENT